MKKLFVKTAAVVFLFSLILSACKKIQPNGAEFTIEYHWTPAGGTTEKQGTGDITDGEENVTYSLNPILHAPGICAKGTWGFTNQPPGAANSSVTQDEKGKLSFTPFKKGTYVLTITYTCSDFTYEQEITIIVK